MRFFISNQSGFGVVQLKLLTLVLALSTILLPLSAKAVTIVVNSTNGASGGVASCSLADAIIAANMGTTSGGCSAGSNGGDEIIFDGSLNNSMITLTANLPTVTNDLIVTGPSGNNQITISGDDTYSIFIVQGVRLNLLNLKLTEGYGTALGTGLGAGLWIGTSGQGGAVAALSGALVTVDNATLSDNNAGLGGAVYAESFSSVSLTNCIISNNSAYLGGGISTFSGANVDVINSTLSNNSSVSSTGYGGAIAAGGSPTIGSSVNVRHSIFSNNSSDHSGGAIMANYSAHVDVIDSTFLGNSAYKGGAIHVNNGASVNLSRSSFSDNSALSNGGAISTDTGTLVNVLNCTFSNNNANNRGGAVFAYATTVNLNTVTASGNYAGRGGAVYAMAHPNLPPTVVQLRRSFLSDNSAGQYGGAVAAEYGAFVAVSESTLSSNSANIRGGAVFADESVVEFSNSTVSSNYSGVEGGAIYANNATSLELNNSTLAENIGGSVFAFNASGAVLRNTVLAGGHCDQDASSTVTLNGGVHIDDGTCGATLVGPSQLAQLDYNGADPIPTHMPIPGSPLVDHGVGGANPATDQLGNNRIVGVAIDIGAVELSDPPLFDIYNLNAFLQTLTTDQSIAMDLDDYITDSDSSRPKVTAKHLPHGLTRNSSSGTPRDIGVFITEYTVEGDTGNQVKAFIDTTVLKRDERNRRFK